MPVTPTARPVVVVEDEVRSLAPVSSLWACCAVPGSGPEYRFTGTAGGPARRFLTAVRARRDRRRDARTLRRAYRELATRYHALLNGDRSC